MRKRWAGGFIRKGVYILDRYRGAVRFKFSTGCRTPEGAAKALAEWECGKDPRASQDTGFEDAVTAYVKHSTATNGEKHVRMQIAAFARWAEFGLCDLRSTTTALGHSFIEWRRSGLAGWHPPRTLVPLGTAAVNRDLAALKALCAWAERTGRMPEGWAPLKRVPLLRENHDVRPHRVVEHDHVLAVLDALAPRWADAGRVLYGSAFRWGSLARLNLGSIDERRSIIRDATPKGGTAIEVAVSADVLAAAKRCCGHALPDDEAQQFGRRLASACRRAGVPRFTAHDLRVSAATWMVTKGNTPIKVVQLILGHRHARTTEHYVRHGAGVARGPI